MDHLTSEQLEAGLPHILASPQDDGVLEMVLRRPDVDQREVLDEAELSLEEGVVGDNWNQRSSGRTDDGSPHPDMQLNVMNARAVALVAGARERWSLAGDQLYVDFDITEANVPPGTRLAIGSAVIEVTDQPHTGCAKFTQRFGLDAHRFVNSRERADLHLRGINARVVTPGTIRPGDRIKKL
ncbi:MAG: MOSC domain-containing protein [Actinomycetota bacterium]